MPALRSAVFARQQIFRVAVAALRDDVRMLDEQELIGNQSALALLDQIAAGSRTHRRSACARGREPHSPRYLKH